MKQLLRWMETALLAVGIVLALWCAFVVLRGYYYSTLPIPPPPPATSLPGEGTRRAPVVSAAVAPGTWVARLEAPSIDLTATVLEGSDDGTLARAAGHIEDTAFPGERGNIGIAGHRDTVFRPLRRVHVGDPLVLTTADRVFRYRVAETKVVGPEDVYVLDPTDHPAMTLVTCYPFEFIGHAPKRFVVRTELVREEARNAGPGRSGEPGGADQPDPPGVRALPSRHDLVVVDAKHQGAGRRHPDRPRARSNRERRAGAGRADPPADGHRRNWIIVAAKRIVSVGASGLRRALTDGDPPARK